MGERGGWKKGTKCGSVTDYKITLSVQEVEVVTEWEVKEEKDRRQAGGSSSERRGRNRV